jgi:hypothetical protein
MLVTRTRLAALLIAVVAIGAIGVLRPDDSVQAQPPSAESPANGRFQISAYSGPSTEGVNPGCYIVDTATGRVWHTRLGAGLVEVSKQPLLGAR